MQTTNFLINLHKDPTFTFNQAETGLPGGPLVCEICAVIDMLFPVH